MQEQGSSEVLFDGKIITLRVETIPQPRGGISRFEIVEHPDAVAVVALRFPTEDGSKLEPEVILVNQERPAIKKQTWEIPAGLVEKSERDSPLQTAVRELREETGYVADHWQLLTREYPSPGFSTEVISIYLATQLHPSTDISTATAPLDSTEIARVCWMPLSEAMVRCNRGEIEDGKTLLGLNLVQNMLMSNAKTAGGSTMPRDLTNMPFPRAATFRGTDATEPQVTATSTLNATLNIENMLLEEFNYAGLTAYQAMEDRARVSNLYYLLLGAVTSGLLAIYQFGGTTHSYSQPLVIVLFVAAGLLSSTFYEKIIRLRQAYRESLICMNVIKEFYIQQFQQQMPHIESAFRWRLRTIPPGERIGSVTFAISALIALMGSFCFASAILVGIKPGILTNPSGFGALPYVISIVVFLIVLLVYVWYYRRALNKHKEQEILEEQAKEIGISDLDHESRSTSFRLRRN